MPTDQTTLALAYLADHKWVPLAALVIGLAVRLLKADTRLPTLPPRWRFWVALGLGILSAIAERVATGVPWRDALVGGLISTALAATGHDAIVRSLRGGREVALPKSLLIPAPPSPPTPPLKDEESPREQDRPTPDVATEENEPPRGDGGGDPSPGG